MVGVPDSRDRAFWAGCGRIRPRAELQIPDQIGLSGENGASARPRAWLPGAVLRRNLRYPFFFWNSLARWIIVFHFQPFTFMPAASPGVSLPIPLCGRTWL